MKENRLKIKDLVTIGVFAVIYFVVMFSVGMIGLIPILFLVYPTILGIVDFWNTYTIFYDGGRSYIYACSSCICSNAYSRVDKKNRQVQFF